MAKFHSVEQIIKEVTAKIPTQHKRWVDIFAKSYRDTIQNTVNIMEDETVFVITGDIDAMWLRDSTAQMRPYLIAAKNDHSLQKLIAGLLKRQLFYIDIDPYANAFNIEANGACYEVDITDHNPWVWERKYELDSLCYPIQLSYLLWKNTGYTQQFDSMYLMVVKKMVDTIKVEQNHDESPYSFERDRSVATFRQEDTLVRNGKGPECGYTGMSWSGFRPSDDAQTYSYHIPANMFSSVVLRYLEEILDEFYDDPEFKQIVVTLRKEIITGIESFGWNELKQTYAYEVDGLGNMNLIDDANVPSLLSSAYLGYASIDNPKYQATRSYILSDKNEYYYKGKYAKGIGSSHTDPHYVWPIALAMQGLTSDSKTEIESILDTLAINDGGTLCMHEGFHVDNPHLYTREWFSWANMMFCELVLKYIGKEVQV